MAMTEITFEKMDGVGIITMNRPESRNALTLNMVSEMGEAIEACKRPDVRAVLLTGAGGGFCSGADLKFLMEIQEKGDEKGLQEYITTLANDLHHKVVLGLRRLGKPVVAGINGVAAAGAACIATARDFRIGADDCRVSYPEVPLGMNLSWSALPLCVHLIGPARAKRMVMLGQQEDARTLLDWGFLDEVVPASQLLETGSGPTRTTP